MRLASDRPARTGRRAGLDAPVGFARLAPRPPREIAVIAEWYVPPDGLAARAYHATQVIGDVARQLPHGVPAAQVVRDRVEAAGVHHRAPGALAGGVMGEVHAVHELWLAGQVARSRCRPGRRPRRAAPRTAEVRADRADHHPGARGDVGEPVGARTSAMQQGELGQRRVDPRRAVPAPSARACGLRPASAQRSPAGLCGRGTQRSGHR